MKRNNKYIFLLISSLLFGCQKEIEIALPNQDSNYVVNCLFQPFTIPYPQNISAYMGETISILDTIDYPIIDNAKLTLFHNDLLIDSLEYFDKTSLYTSSKIHSLSPGRYQLKVEHNENIIIAEDILPEKVLPTKISILPFAGRDDNNRSYAKVSFTLNDPEDQDNYYEIFLSSTAFSDPHNIFTDFPPITSESYYPTVMSFWKRKPVSLPFSDKEINGKEVVIPIHYLHAFEDFDDVVDSHTITIHFRTISENYYNYKVSLLKQGYHLKDDIIYGQAEPINVFSNIPGNSGIFAAYQSLIQTFIILNNDYIEIEL
ncbi:MAG: DUF4249 domain-containing protein [Bacteroidales bacterium]|nr:DUF4249 domain-containing protein [Bacteroidales bacterium]